MVLLRCVQIRLSEIQHNLIINDLTLPGSNMEVENGPWEDHFPLQTGGFPLPC